eukprot:m.277658 g.277658  ORF g.277658 m.277658 type:complete len:463 (+) comp11101_c0_seq64:2751-4139(+)
MSKAISKSVKKRQQSLKAQRDYAVLEQRGEIVSPSEYAALVSRAEPRFRDIVAAAAAMGAKGVPREDYAFALGYVLAVHYAHDPPHRIALLAGITVGDRFKTAQAFGAQAVVVGATTLEVWAEWARTVRAGLQRGDTALFTGAPAKSLSHTLTRFSHHFGKHITSTSIRASVHTHAAQHLSPAEVAAIARTDTHSMSTAAAFYDRRGAEQAAAAAAAATSKLRALGNGSGGIDGSVKRWWWEGGSSHRLTANHMKPDRCARRSRRRATAVQRSLRPSKVACMSVCLQRESQTALMTTTTMMTAPHLPLRARAVQTRRTQRQQTAAGAPRGTTTSCTHSTPCLRAVPMLTTRWLAGGRCCAQMLLLQRRCSRPTATPRSCRTLRAPCSPASTPPAASRHLSMPLLTSEHSLMYTWLPSGGCGSRGQWRWRRLGLSHTPLCATGERAPDSPPPPAPTAHDAAWH